MKRYEKPVMDILKIVNNKSVASLSSWLMSAGVDDGTITPNLVTFTTES